MEFVDGLDLDSWAQERALDWPGAVALLRRVCSAVAFAHRRLVQHLDLKPNNVLVTTDGQPKLVNFGTAELMGQSPVGRRPTTPSWAASESLRGEQPSTAGDVHALGRIPDFLAPDSGRSRDSDAVIARAIDDGSGPALLIRRASGR